MARLITDSTLCRNHKPALYSFNPVSLVVLGYIGHLLYQLWHRARQAVGAVDLVVESYEPLVDEAAAARASKQVGVSII